MTTPDPKGFWDERYESDAFIYGERPSRQLLGWADYITANAKTALVPASGEGRDAVYLARMGLDVTAVDLSPIGLEKTRRLADRHEVTVATIEANLLDWEWPNGRVDLIASTFAHMPPAVRGPLHSRMVDALSPNGLLFLEGFTKEQAAYQEKYKSGGPPDADMLYAPEDIKADFAALEPLSFFTGVETLFEGPGHSGPAALMRAVFKKAG